MACGINAQVAVFCDLCHSEDEVISWECLVCNEYMCRNCSIAHQRSRASRDHHMKFLDGKEIDYLEQKRKSFLCCTHQGEELILFCKNCDVLVCTDCVINQHKQHAFVKVKDICEDERKKLQHSNKEIIDLIGRLKPVKNNLELKKQEMIKLNQDMSTTNLIKTHNAKQLLLKQRDYVNRQNSNITDINIDTIGKEANRLQQDLTTLDNLQASTHNEAIKGLGNTEVIQMRYKVNSILNKINPGNFDISKLSLLPLQEVEFSNISGNTSMNSNIKMVSRLKITGRQTKRIWSVCPISQSQAWIHIYADYPNYLINWFGEVEKIEPCDYYVTKFALTSDRKNILASSFYNTSIEMMSLNLDQPIDFTTENNIQYPNGFCITGNGEVLVCMIEREEVTDRIITIKRFTNNGEVIKTISYKSESPQTDYVRVPNNVAENPKTGDICLIERSHDTHQNNLVILNKSGKKKATYSGKNKLEGFDPSDIICDKKGQIIVADREKRIHLLSQDCQFLQYIISEEEKFVPISLALDSVNGQLWVGCEDGFIIVCRHE